MDKTKQKCKGKWKEHGELETTRSTNNLGTFTVIQKQCLRCNRFVYWELVQNNVKVKKENSGYVSLPFDERLKLATHYKKASTEPSSSLCVGFVGGNIFFDLYISLHKSEVKRLGLIEYNEYEKN